MLKPTALLILILILLPSISIASTSPSKVDIYWLTQNIYQESRNQSTYGQFLVGFVTLERLDDGRWGDSIKKVVTSKKQFSWYNKKKSHIPSNKEAWERCKNIAIITMLVHEYINGTGIFFYHNKTVDPKWNRSMDKMIVEGEHIFYRENLTN